MTLTLAATVTTAATTVHATPKKIVSGSHTESAGTNGIVLRSAGSNLITTKPSIHSTRGASVGAVGPAVLSCTHLVDVNNTGSNSETDVTSVAVSGGNVSGGGKPSSTGLATGVHIT